MNFDEWKAKKVAAEIRLAEDKLIRRQLLKLHSILLGVEEGQIMECDLANLIRKELGWPKSIEETNKTRKGCAHCAAGSEGQRRR